MADLKDMSSVKLPPKMGFDLALDLDDQDEKTSKNNNGQVVPLEIRWHCFNQDCDKSVVIFIAKLGISVFLMILCACQMIREQDSSGYYGNLLFFLSGFWLGPKGH